MIHGCGFTEIQSASKVEFMFYFFSPYLQIVLPTVINATSAARTDEAAAAWCPAVIAHLHPHTS